MLFTFFIFATVSNFLICAYGSENAKERPLISSNSTQYSNPSFNPVVSDVSGNSKCRIKSSNNCRNDGPSSCILSLLDNARSIMEDAKKFVALRERCSDSMSCEKPMDCSEIKRRNPYSKSGVFKIWPRSRLSSGPISVYCDMEDEGGAWTVIQRRGNFDSGEQYFYQDWLAYKNGFGNIQKDFWLGNDNIFALTNQISNMVKFTLSDWEGNKTYATYDKFWIDDEVHKYTLHVQGYRGTAGDSFSGHNGAPFTTKDQHNDSHNKNCAVESNGAWWYKACRTSNLNGAYLKGVHGTFANGVNWQSFRGLKYSLKDTVIKIRRKDYTDIFIDVTPH